VETRKPMETLETCGSKRDSVPANEQHSWFPSIGKPANLSANAEET
jgi:hypothetical protein